jgi:hypothetical protein
MDFKMDLDGGSPAMIKSMKLNVCTLAWCTPAMGGGPACRVAGLQSPLAEFPAPSNHLCSYLRTNNGCQRFVWKPFDHA